MPRVIMPSGLGRARPLNRRATPEIADRIAGLQELDARLAGLGRHLDRPRRSLDIIDASGPCCDAADAVVGSVESTCACCAPASEAATAGSV
jgi:hypothetical protein